MEVYMTSDKHMTEVEYLPVCKKCGHVFYTGIQLQEEVIETELGIKVSEQTILPSFCPECGKHIKQVRWNDLLIERRTI